MKKIVLFVAVIVFAVSCKKTDEFVNSSSFKKITYEIMNSVDTLHVTYRYGVYTSTIKGNIDSNIAYTTKGTFYISTDVLIGQPVIFTGISFNGGDFHLKIKDTSGNVIIETDTVAHYPANQLHRDEYESQIQFTP